MSTTDFPETASAPAPSPLSGSDKDPDALRTIGEVAAMLGLRQHVLRYWEEQFPMLKPLKRSGGRRYYRTADVRLVETIDRLVHREGYTLKGARAVLAGKATAAPQSASEQVPPAPPAGELDRRAGLMAIRTALAEALARA